LYEALDLYDKDYHVILFICADCLQSNIPSWISIKPDHVVALAGTFHPPASESYPVSIPIFTWGRKTTIPMQGGLTYGQFLDQYYAAGATQMEASGQTSGSGTVNNASTAAMCHPLHRGRRDMGIVI
jgi:hypothetical protein